MTSFDKAVNYDETSTQTTACALRDEAYSSYSKWTCNEPQKFPSGIKDLLPGMILTDTSPIPGVRLDASSRLIGLPADGPTKPNPFEPFTDPDKISDDEKDCLQYTLKPGCDTIPVSKKSLDAYREARTTYLKYGSERVGGEPVSKAPKEAADAPWQIYSGKTLPVASERCLRKHFQKPIASWPVLH